MNNFTLFSLIRIALKNIFIIILVAVLCAAGTFSYFNFVANPKYQAKGSIMVTNGAIIIDSDTDKSSLDNQDIYASINFLNTVIDILKTSDIYKELAEDFQGKYTYQQLQNYVAISRRENNTLFIDVSFTTNSITESKELVNGFLQMAPDYIYKFVPSTKIAVASIAENATKVYPTTVKFTLVAALFGAVITYLILFLVYLFNTVIIAEEDFADRFNVTVLGCIPDFASAKSNKYDYYSYSKGGKGK